MPVKNAAPFLDATLYSIIDQSYPHWELIAINDHSTDETVEIFKKYQKKYPNHHISFLQNDGRGIVAALRLAFQRAKGDFIHRMDADDIMPEKKLEWLIHSWKPNAVVTGKVKYFSEEWMVGGGFKKYEDWINQNMEASDFWSDVYMECPLPSPAWLIHRNDLIKIGAFDSDAMPEDYDLCFRMYQHQLEVITVKEIVHFWRDSKTRTSRNDEIYFPIKYFPLKVRKFLEIEALHKPILLWGAGKKGKLICKLLKDANAEFLWYTDNERKQGIAIQHKIIEKNLPKNLERFVIILAISSPEDKEFLKIYLTKHNLVSGINYFWFC